MNNKNGFQQYLDDIAILVKEENYKRIEKVIESRGDTTLTFEQARVSYEELFQDMLTVLHDMTTLQEERIQAIIRNLPPHSRRLVEEAFIEAEGKLLQDKDIEEDNTN